MQIRGFRIHLLAYPKSKGNSEQPQSARPLLEEGSVHLGIWKKCPSFKWVNASIPIYDGLQSIYPDIVFWKRSFPKISLGNSDVIPPRS